MGYLLMNGVICLVIGTLDMYEDNRMWRLKIRRDRVENENSYVGGFQFRMGKLHTSIWNWGYTNRIFVQGYIHHAHSSDDTFGLGQ